jgi:hypothetical protein
MPWKFIRSTDAELARARERTLQRIDAWWAAFAEAAPQAEALVRAGRSGDLGPWMRGQLDVIDPRLNWEAGVEEEGGNCYLVVTPETEWSLRPMARSLVDRAPVVTGWRFYAYRPPLSAEAAAARVRAETGQVMGISMIAPRIGARNRVDLLFQHKLARTDLAAGKRAAAAAARSLLGEETFFQWVGDIDVVAPSRESGWENFLLPQRLRTTLTSLTQSIVNTLPAKPYWQIHTRELESAAFKYDPLPADDYGLQEDLVVGTNLIPEFRRAVASKLPFFSSSFSRQGETFGYLKIDASDASMDQRLVRRQKFEERIHVPLRKAECARVVGSGTGLRYLYYDLAITDIAKTIATVRTQLLKKGLPDRSWLLFYDAELRDEYIGLRSGSPPPPEPRRVEKPKDEPPQTERAETGPHESNMIPPEGEWLNDPLPTMEDPLR